MTDITDKLLEERAKTHGSFEAHARITQDLKRAIHPWRNSTLSNEHREAIDMIVHKIGRILAGNPNYNDHWDDIAGYAKLGSIACKTKSVS